MNKPIETIKSTVRVTLKAQETRERILQAAIELFQEKGFEATTMRDIAERSQVALGAAYYYFKTKEEMVMAFYRRSQDDFVPLSEKIFAETSDFKKRLEALIESKLEQFRPYRSFLNILFRVAGDPEHSLSPFSSASGPIREESIAIFRRSFEGTKFRIPEDLKRFLPSLLWLYQMGIILYWIHDRSSEQRRTELLRQYSLDILMQFIRLARLPLFARPRRRLLQLLEAMEKLPE